MPKKPHWQTAWRAESGYRPAQEGDTTCATCKTNTGGRCQAHHNAKVAATYTCNEPGPTA